MNKEKLVEEMVNMSHGDTYTMYVLDENKNEIWVTNLTKTRWFDSRVIIIGGTGGALFVSKPFDSENIKNVSLEFIEKFILDVFRKEYNDFKLTDKSRLLIQSNTPAFNQGYMDNFGYFDNI